MFFEFVKQCLKQTNFVILSEKKGLGIPEKNEWKKKRPEIKDSGSLREENPRDIGGLDRRQPPILSMAALMGDRLLRALKSANMK